jgi:hypothetical protein
MRDLVCPGLWAGDNQWFSFNRDHRGENPEAWTFMPLSHPPFLRLAPPSLSDNWQIGQ